MKSQVACATVKLLDISRNGMSSGAAGVRIPSSHVCTHRMPLSPSLSHPLVLFAPFVCTDAMIVRQKTVLRPPPRTFYPTVPSSWSPRGSHLPPLSSFGRVRLAFLYSEPSALSRALLFSFSLWHVCLCVFKRCCSMRCQRLLSAGRVASGGLGTRWQLRAGWFPVSGLTGPR